VCRLARLERLNRLSTPIAGHLGTQHGELRLHLSVFGWMQAQFVQVRGDLVDEPCKIVQVHTHADHLSHAAALLRHVDVSVDDVHD